MNVYLVTSWVQHPFHEGRKLVLEYAFIEANDPDDEIIQRFGKIPSFELDVRFCLWRTVLLRIKLLWRKHAPN